ncbi:hypothetical protein [Vibrio quintilis]|nr:hypothetical protein [Vibrio quintilis]
MNELWWGMLLFYRVELKILLGGLQPEKASTFILLAFLSGCVNDG